MAQSKGTEPISKEFQDAIIETAKLLIRKTKTAPDGITVYANLVENDWRLPGDKRHWIGIIEEVLKDQFQDNHKPTLDDIDDEIRSNLDKGEDRRGTPFVDEDDLIKNHSPQPIQWKPERLQFDDPDEQQEWLLNYVRTFFSDHPGLKEIEINLRPLFGPETGRAFAFQEERDFLNTFSVLLHIYVLGGIDASAMKKHADACLTKVEKLERAVAELRALDPDRYTSGLKTDTEIINKIELQVRFLKAGIESAKELTEFKGADFKKRKINRVVRDLYHSLRGDDPRRNRTPINAENPTNEALAEMVCALLEHSGLPSDLWTNSKALIQNLSENPTS